MGEAEEVILADFINYLSNRGVTSLLDAGNFGLDEKVYRAVKRLDDNGALPMRYHGAYTVFLPNQAETAVEELKRLAAAYNSENLKIDTLKIFFDGVVETRTAHMLQDYDDTPGNRGGSLFGVDTLTKLILEVDQAGFNLHVHALGDQSSRTVLDAVEAARKQLARPLDITVAITHLQVIDAADFARYAELVVQRIVAAVERPQDFPESGRVVPELDCPEIREIITRPYRVVYRYRGESVEIATVFRSSRQIPEIA